MSPGKTRGRKKATARSAPAVMEPIAQPPYLFEEFRDGPPHAPPLDSEGLFERGRIAKVQRLYLLFKTAQGFSANRIALELGISRSSARRILDEARCEPEKFYLWGFVTRWRPRSTVKYFCRLCGWIESDVRECAYHAYGHLWPEEDLEIRPSGL